MHNVITEIFAPCSLRPCSMQKVMTLVGAGRKRHLQHSRCNNIDRLECDRQNSLTVHSLSPPVEHSSCNNIDRLECDRQNSLTAHSLSPLVEHSRCNNIDRLECDRQNSLTVHSLPHTRWETRIGKKSSEGQVWGVLNVQTLIYVMS